MLEKAMKELGTELLRIAAHRVYTELEPTKDMLTVRPGKVGVITKTLRGLQHDQYRKLSKPTGREDFLYAVRNYLTPLDHEELIVAFGHRIGSHQTKAAQIASLYRAVGTRDSVAMTPMLRALMVHHAETTRRGEVLVVHNHPPHPITGIIAKALGPRPIPSAQDRRLAIQLSTDKGLLALFDEHATSWQMWLVEDGDIQRFFLPDFEGPLSKILAEQP